MNEAIAEQVVSGSGGSPVGIVVVLVLGGLAFAYLARGVIRKRSRTLSGEGCGDCAGCGTTGAACHVAPSRAIDPANKPH